MAPQWNPAAPAAIRMHPPICMTGFLKYEYGGLIVHYASGERSSDKERAMIKKIQRNFR